MRLLFLDVPLTSVAESDTQSSATSTSGAFSTQSHGKRRRSPTEQIPQDKRGDVRLAKRASVKKKHPTWDLPGSSAFPPGVSLGERHSRSYPS